MGSIDRRQHERVPFRAPAFLHQGKKVIFGEIRDISRNGLYLSVRGDHEPNRETDVTIYILKGTLTLSITVPGRIVRRGSDGIGFSSPYIDPLALLSSKSLLSYSDHDPALAMEEFISRVLPTFEPVSPLFN